MQFQTNQALLVNEAKPNILPVSQSGGQKENKCIQQVNH